MSSTTANQERAGAEHPREKITLDQVGEIICGLVNLHNTPIEETRAKVERHLCALQE
jgi:hypothetical protein